MTGDSPLVVSRPAAAAALLIVLAAGAGGAWFVMREHVGSDRPSAGGGAATVSSPPVARAGEPAPSTSSDSPAEVTVSLTRDAVARAGIVVAPASTRAMTEDLRLPGVVEPNAYRQVIVTPLVGGRLVRVSAQLGDRVRRSQSLAQIYSPELADVRTKYIAARAMLDAHDRELKRTQKLAEIGAASRQELERLHAEHAAQLAEVASARSRLELLGATAPDDVSDGGQDAGATANVRAPIDGVVTERGANVGLNVDPATRLFTVVDLSDVWVIANVYERDLHRVHLGDAAAVTARAYPERSFEGRVTYIDAQLSEDTRTAKVRIEVANPHGDLRLGMYADVTIAAAGSASVVTVPKSSIQDVGSHQVVYVPAPNDPGTFIEREVQAGHSVGDSVEVVSGVNAGDSVVSEGSFFIRSEVERLGLRGAADRAAMTRRPTSQGSSATADVQTAKVVVGEEGYQPARITLRRGVPARITFLRTTDRTCGTEVVFPALDIRRALPLNQPVTIELTPARTEEIAFACGMNMLHGAVVVR